MAGTGVMPVREPMRSAVSTDVLGTDVEDQLCEDRVDRLLGRLRSRMARSAAGCAGDLPGLSVRQMRSVAAAAVVRLLGGDTLARARVASTNGLKAEPGCRLP